MTMNNEGTARMRRPENPPLSQRIREKRERQGLSLRDAGEASGVAFSTLARIELGKEPSLKVYQKVVAWLEGAEPILPPPPMTLRDWFAGLSIEQCIRNALNDDGSWQPENVAYHAYLIADAMLTERERSQ